MAQSATEIDIGQLAREIVDIIADKKGENVVLMDIRGQTIIADYFVICSGSSERQIKAIVDSIEEEIKQRYRLTPRATEGSAETGWVLLDYYDIVIHAFAPETRTYYDLEGFWMEHDASILLKIQ